MNRKGFTLMEVLIAIAIIAILVAGFFPMFGFGARLMGKTFDFTTDTFDAQRAVERAIAKSSLGRNVNLNILGQNIQGKILTQEIQPFEKDATGNLIYDTNGLPETVPGTSAHGKIVTFYVPRDATVLKTLYPMAKEVTIKQIDSEQLNQGYQVDVLRAVPKGTIIDGEEIDKTAFFIYRWYTVEVSGSGKVDLNSRVLIKEWNQARLDPRVQEFDRMKMLKAYDGSHQEIPTSEIKKPGQAGYSEYIQKLNSIAIHPIPNIANTPDTNVNDRFYLKYINTNKNRDNELSDDEQKVLYAARHVQLGVIPVSLDGVMGDEIYSNTIDLGFPSLNNSESEFTLNESEFFAGETLVATLRVRQDLNLELTDLAAEITGYGISQGRRILFTDQRSEAGYDIFEAKYVIPPEAREKYYIRPIIKGAEMDRLAKYYEVKGTYLIDLNVKAVAHDRPVITEEDLLQIEGKIRHGVGVNLTGKKVKIHVYFNRTLIKVYEPRISSSGTFKVEKHPDSGKLQAGSYTIVATLYDSSDDALTTSLRNVVVHAQSPPGGGDDDDDDDDDEKYKFTVEILNFEKGYYHIRDVRELANPKLPGFKVRVTKESGDPVGYAKVQVKLDYKDSRYGALTAIFSGFTDNSGNVTILIPGYHLPHFTIYVATITVEKSGKQIGTEHREFRYTDFLRARNRNKDSFKRYPTMYEDLTTSEVFLTSHPIQNTWNDAWFAVTMPWDRNLYCLESAVSGKFLVGLGSHTNEKRVFGLVSDLFIGSRDKVPDNLLYYGERKGGAKPDYKKYLHIMKRGRLRGLKQRAFNRPQRYYYYVEDNKDSTKDYDIPSVDKIMLLRDSRY